MLNPKGHRKSAVAIKRVLTQGDVCICGICRKTYKDVRQANACLARCLSGHLNPSEPVVALSEAGAKKFRCHFCRRVFTERNKAVECASACKVKTNAIVANEHPESTAQTQINVKLREPSKPVRKTPVDRRDQMHKFFRDGRKLICRKCGLEKMTLDDVIACFDSHPEKIRKTNSDRKSEATKNSVPKLKIVKPSISDAENSAKAPRLANEDEKFHRDGARYVCRQCGKKTFTREDVFACYDSHAGERPEIKSNVTVESNKEPIPPPTKTQKVSSIDDDHKFFRDGARYICRNCQTKHFTRGDVTACFDSHG